MTLFSCEAARVSTIHGQDWTRDFRKLGGHNTKAGDLKESTSSCKRPLGLNCVLQRSRVAARIGWADFVLLEK